MAGCKQFRVFRACLEESDNDLREDEGFAAFDATLIVDDEVDDVGGNQEGNESNDDESIAPIPQPTSAGDPSGGQRRKMNPETSGTIKRQGTTEHRMNDTKMWRRSMTFRRTNSTER